MAEMKYKLLKDYVPPIYRQQSVSLEFFLDPKKTILKSKIHFSHNNGKPTDLILQGENIKLSYLTIDGKQIGLDHLTVKKHILVIPKKFLGPREFQIEMENILSPSTNKTLEGLYLSEGIFVTQCEPEGFRKIC